VPEGYAEAWRRLDDEFGSRTRQEAALQIEGTLRAHDWDGGYRCVCGRPISMPREWGQHLLELVLFDEADE
jgi:hypothetical protein